MKLQGILLLSALAPAFASEEGRRLMGGLIPGDECMVPNDSAALPFQPLGFEFSNFLNTIPCDAQLLLKTDELQHKVEFISRTVVEKVDGTKQTNFVYDVCTKPWPCQFRRKLHEVDDMEPPIEPHMDDHADSSMGRNLLIDYSTFAFNPHAPISYTNFGMVGDCTITSFTALEIEVGTNPLDDGVDVDVFLKDATGSAVGLDWLTCQAGFSFRCRFTELVKNGCLTGNWCQRYVLGVDGEVPAGPVQAVTKASTGFAEHSTLGPHCTPCPH